MKRMAGSEHAKSHNKQSQLPPRRTVAALRDSRVIESAHSFWQPHSQRATYSGLGAIRPSETLNVKRQTVPSWRA